MCGINGIIRFDDQMVTESEIQAMNKMIAHRGPDDEGVFIDHRVGLGHVRLSILDLSARGHQPMCYEHQGKRAVITYNGEVYNFLELRKELIGKGYHFHSNTDTEVLIAAYLEYGFDCVKRFNGMFSLVIYDVDRQIIFGARDRFGEKPFKYYRDQSRFIFSSELKSILCNEGVMKEIDADAIDSFLTLQYVPSPKTGFKNICKLPQAHRFVLDLKTQELRIDRYFDLDYSKKLDLTENEWIDLIERELGKTVEKRLLSDVPLGAFLSGGVDSSAIVAFMSKFTDRIKTYSISFGEKDFDESVYAKKVAKIYRTEHTEFRVQPGDLISHIEELVTHFEEPYADSSCLPTFVLARLARKHVTVALSGDAGDENFGGYDRHRRHAFVQKYKWLLTPLFLLSPLVILGKKMIPHGGLDKLYLFLKTLNRPLARRHFNYTTYFDEWTKQEFYDGNFKEKLGQERNIFENLLKNDNFDDMDKAYYLDLNSYIPDDINVKVDMASMANALEVRAPMLDHEFVGAMAQMPWRMKTDARQGKIIFKKMLEKYLPPEILYRKKQGFGVPIKHWFRGELKEYLVGTLMDKRGLVLRIMRKDRIEALIHEHMSGKDNANKLWMLLVLNLWYRRYFQDDVHAAACG